MRSQVDPIAHSSSALHLYIPPSPESPSRSSESPTASTATKRGRGRKRDDTLPYNRARDVQRAFRARRAAHLESLEERVLDLEAENAELRTLLNLPQSARPPLGKGPTGRGKALVGDPSHDSRMRVPSEKNKDRGSPTNTSSSHSSSPESIATPMVNTPWNNWDQHHADQEDHIDSANSSAVSAIGLDVPSKCQYLPNYLGGRNLHPQVQNLHDATPPYSDISNHSSTNTSPAFPLRDLQSHSRHSYQPSLQRFVQQNNDAVPMQLHSQVYPQQHDYSFSYSAPIPKQEDGMDLLPTTLSSSSSSAQLPCAYTRHRSGTDPSIPRDFPLASNYTQSQRHNDMPIRLSPSIQSSGGIHSQYPYRV
ncbi:hypothetical protein FRC03_010444 [Tulasnella sp. 419]|nr:hypothetical protein FRC03_010444 [Tulasnella sp. 419]